MKSLFFFTTSLNFGNIFSSESISPESFYTKRGFGFDYYENPFPNIKDYIVFFEEYPNIDIATSNEIDLYKIIIEIDASDIQVQKSEIKGVLLCQNTVYFNLKVIKKIYFCSKEEKNKVLARAESSKALKTLSKYEQFFTVMPHTQQISYNISIIEYLPNKELEKSIIRDKIFNNFKGFIYGLICGKLNHKNPNEVSYIKSLQDIKNGFALLKNSLAHNSSNTYSKERKHIRTTKSYDYNSTIVTLKNLKNSIEESERLFISFIDIIGEVDYVSEYLKLNIFKDFKQTLNKDHLEGALQLAKSMQGFEKILEKEARNWFWDKNPDNSYILYEILTYSVLGYSETTNKEKHDDFDSNILKALYKLENYAEKVILEKSKNESIIDFNLIDFRNLNIILPQNLNKDDKFEQLINMVLYKAKKGKGKINDQQLIPIVENAGEIFKEGQGKKSNLYRYFTKMDTFYQEKNETPIVMKNFTAFVFNPNDVEKLQKYIEDKVIIDPQYAFAFFGAFNGFASLSKDFTKAIFLKKEFQNNLDIYFKNIQINLNQVTEFSRMETNINPELSKEISYEEIMSNANPSSSTQISKNNYIIQDYQKIDLQELKEEIIMKSKREKIIKHSFQDDFNHKLDNSLKEIDQLLFGLPFSGQMEFAKNRLFILLTKKHKVKGLGELTIKKLFD